ncbi:MAG: Wzz/FepE/Etk N-terminal domain-containing protein [Endomicrobia bacterium]|nr:Wzz/FepE/Etk N-terminal domain-containing protein [Endomicrobiia bacterium]
MEEELTIKDIIKFLFKHKKIIIETTFIFFILGVTFALLQKKTYTAEAAIMILGVKPKVTLETKIELKDALDNIYQQFEQRKKTVVELLKSPLIVSEVLNKLQWQGLIKLNKFSVSDFLNSKVINVEIVGEIIKVKVRLSDKVLAKNFADELVKTLVEKMSSVINYSISKDILKDKYEQTKQDYELLQAKYNSFIEKNRITELNKELTQLEDLYKYYVSSLTKIEKLIHEAEGIKQQFQSSNTSSVGEFANALSLLKLKSSMFVAEGELPIQIDLGEVSSEKLKFQDISNGVFEVEEIIKILKDRKTEFSNKLKEEKFEEKIQHLKKEIEKEKNKETQLLKDKNLAWESLLMIERKQKELEISNGISEDIPIKIVYFSVLPEKPDSGKRKIYIATSIFIGFVLGILISWIKEALSDIK